MEVQHAQALHRMLLEHLEHLGLAETLLEPLRAELAKARESAKGSMLYELYMYAAEGLLSLALSSMSGSQIRLSIDIATTVRELKTRYAESTSVPVREQQLVYQGETLHDADFLAAHRLSPFDSHITVVRVRPPKLYVIGGLSYDESVASMEVLDTADHSWEILPSMTTTRGGSFGAAVIDEKLYVVGGTDQHEEQLDSAEVFIPTIAKWTSLPPMMTPRHNFVTAVANGRLYVIGGDDGVQALSASEMFDPEAGSWQWIPPMPTPRFYAQSAVIGDRIYVVGGDDGATAFSMLEVLDTSTLTWETLPPMSTPRFGFQVVVSQGKICAVGGYDGQDALASAEMFDPCTGRWEVILPMWTVRSRSASAVVDGRVYALGGYIADESRAEASSEAYDSDIGAWIPLPPMNSARFDSSSATVGRRVYMLGGDSDDGIGATSSAEYFDAEAGHWIQLPPMNMPRRSAVVVGLHT